MSKAKPDPKLEQNLREQLHERGLRVTEPRMKILMTIALAKGPISQNDLTDALARDGLDRVTLYRNLLSLADTGIILRTDLGDHTWRYSLSGGPAEEHKAHPHFVCVDCGNVRCLPEDAVSLRLSVHRAASVLDVQVRGRCEACVGG
jgi:Fur family transcriptional regulator, ferric uptake regulator